MDVERITQELYGLRPADFASARDAYVAEARRRKEPEAAKALAALRRPVLAAWAANLLARERPDEAERFLALGETLRVAHRMLDGERLREASRKQHRLVTALARTAADLAAEAGQPVGDPVLREIEQTLHGVLARPEVASTWAKGRLVKVPDAAVDFAAVVDVGAAKQAGAEARAEAARTEEAAAEAEAEAEAQAEAEAEAKAAAEARAEAEAAAVRAEAARDAAREARDAAAVRAEESEGEVRRLEAALATARDTAHEARTAADRAGAALTAAENTAREARSRAGAGSSGKRGGGRRTG
ncbi:hypothetical protein [Streptomyces sp. NPDC048623]|uniref:hypothetical protein n=1 Tax=Streptomyces sp. NPDC048623 TaxID=3155761 RepID=UPI003434F32A